MRVFNTKWNKVASAWLQIKIYRTCCFGKKHSLVSTGMTKIEEIDEIVEIFKRHNCPITLLHTVSTYPSDDADLNLKCINSLKKI